MKVRILERKDSMEAELRLNGIFPKLEIRPENQLEKDVLSRVSAGDLVNIVKYGWGTDIEPDSLITLEFVKVKKKVKAERFDEKGVKSL